MKKSINHFKHAFLLLILALGMQTGFSQTSVTLSPVTDSLYGQCPTPANYMLYFYGQCGNYTPGVDDMDMFIDYGDGNTSTFSVPINGSVASGWFSGNQNHTYTVAGQYTVTIIATGTDGNDDTIINGPIFVSTVCGTVEGYTYLDHNNNCVYDAGDNALQYQHIKVIDPVSGVLVKWTYSDANGHYSTGIPTGYNFEINSDPAQVLGTQTTCPASSSYAFLSSTGSATFNFGFQTANSIDVIHAYDSTFGYCNPIVNFQMSFYGNCSGYNYLTDDIDIEIYYGDGYDTSFTLPFTYYGSFSSWVYHNYTSPGAYYPMIIATSPDGLKDTLIYATPIMVYNGCGSVEGDLYFDNNSNCTFDAGDDAIPNMNVVVKDQATGNILTVVFTDANGHYTASVPTGLNINVAANALVGAYQMAGITFLCPSSGNYTFMSTSGSSTYNFAMQCNASQFDVSANFTIAGGMVPGNMAQGIVSACNASCNAVSGNITITLDPSVTFAGMVPGYPAPTGIFGNTITWSFTNLNMANYNWSCAQFNFYMAVDTTVVAGDTLCFTTIAAPFAGDAVLPNNTAYQCFPAFASYDPNDKHVYPTGVGAPGYVLPNTTFTYTINFQNTGNFYAQNIYVMDTISNHLDLNTFEILGSSHPMQATIHSANRVKFNFPNIMLIDSTTDEPNSHGWILYRIKTKPGLAEGTEIKNTAHIYFDYNPAVVTNTTLNTVNSFLTLPETPVAVKNEIYPNPTSDVVNVSFEELVNGAVQVRDVTGRIVYNGFIKNTNVFSINVANWNTGMYELSVTGTHITKQRFVVAR